MFKSGCIDIFKLVALFRLLDLAYSRNFDWVLALRYTCETFFESESNIFVWTLGFKLELLYEPDQKQKDLCLGQNLSRAHPLASLEGNHSFVSLESPFLNEPGWVKFVCLSPGVLVHHNCTHAWNKHMTRGDCVRASFHGCFVYMEESVLSCKREHSLMFSNIHFLIDKLTEDGMALNFQYSRLSVRHFASIAQRWLSFLSNDFKNLVSHIFLNILVAA